jgi:hypothetical protein
MPLPRELLRNRLRNEIDVCIRKLSHPLFVSDATYTNFPLLVDVTLVNVPGPVLVDGAVTHRLVHRMKLYITDDYPYQKPVVVWGSDIFHPNIMHPDDGGAVCTRLLDSWSFSSTLVTFVKGIEALLMNPNPKSPYDTPSCTRAAELFSKSPYVPPASAYRGEGEKPPVILCPK